MTTLLGIDIGTTATKVIILDVHKGITAEVSRETNLRSERPGWAEESVDQWWDNVAYLCRGLDLKSVAAIGISGMVPCLVLQGEDGKALRPSIQQTDTRATEEIAELAAEMRHSRVLQRTGSEITQQSIGPKLLWIQRHEPEVWKRTRWVAGSYDTIVRYLTDSPSVELNWALESGLFDIETNDWAPDILKAVAVDRQILPSVHRPSDLVGAVTKAAAKETGLPLGTPVVAGSADHVASAFAAGVVDEGDMLVKLGGAGDILVASDTPLLDHRLYLDLHLVPGKFLPNGCMAASGSFIKWFQATVASGAPLHELDAEAENAGPGAGGVVALPYMVGEKTPLHDPDARGAFINLSLATQRGHLFRAVLESISFGFRHHLEIFRESGLEPKVARVSNGGVNSALWKQVTADILGLPLETLARHPGSALGAAFSAGMGIGAFDTWRDIDRFTRVRDVIEPHPDTRYEQAYKTFRALYPALRSLPD